MIVVRSLILLLLVSVIPCQSLDCYECGCEATNLVPCDCSLVTSSTDNDYCVISEQRYSDTTYIQLGRVPRNATWIYVEDPYYVLTQESIRYNRTASKWSLVTTGVVFGCDWDRCNTANLIQVLPNSFKLNISTTWLNTNIYGTGSVSSCFKCPTELCSNATSPLDFSRCPMTACENVTSVRDILAGDR